MASVDKERRDGSWGREDLVPVPYGLRPACDASVGVVDEERGPTT